MPFVRGSFTTQTGLSTALLNYAGSSGQKHYEFLTGVEIIQNFARCPCPRGPRNGEKCRAFVAQGEERPKTEKKTGPLKGEERGDERRRYLRHV